MPNLETSYLNLTLRNPIIVASSGLTKSVDKIVQCEQAGAGAVVIKSMFEEILAAEDYNIEEATQEHTEAYDYHFSELEKLYGSRDYTNLIKEVKKKVSIPVIASINCSSADWWPNFAEQVEAAGADALELNVFKTVIDPDMNAEAIEEVYYDIVKTVKQRVEIPVAIKIGSQFTSLPNVARNLEKNGVNGIVLFNRFTEIDINVRKPELQTTFTFSREGDYHLPLRWIGILAGQVKCDLSATTGVKNAEDAMKMILAGASTVQVASLLYQKGFDEISTLLQGIEKWLEDRGIESLSKVKGSFRFSKQSRLDNYLRVQFMKKINEYE